MARIIELTDARLLRFVVGMDPINVVAEYELLDGNGVAHLGAMGIEVELTESEAATFQNFVDNHVLLAIRAHEGLDADEPDSEGDEPAP